MLLTTLAWIPLAAPQSCEVDRLGATGSSARDAFGSAIASDGTWLAIGGHTTAVHPNPLSFAYIADPVVEVFRRSGADWLPSQRIVLPGSGDWTDKPAGLDLAGGLLAFANPATGLVRLVNLANPGVGPTPPFAPPPLPGATATSIVDIEVAGNRLFVLEDSVQGPEVRSRVHEYGVTGSQVSWIGTTEVGPIGSASPITSFGFIPVPQAGALEFDGQDLIVGLPGDDTLGLNSGTIRVLSPAPAGWVESQVLFHPQGTWFSGFGDEIALDAGRFVAGAPGSSTPVGTVASAHVFVKTPGGYQLEATLSGLPAQLFGVGLATALLGDELAIGNWRMASVDPEGQARVYRRTGGVWTPDPVVTALVPGPYDGFGFALAFTEPGHLAVGAPRQDSLEGERGIVALFRTDGLGCASTLVAPRHHSIQVPLGVDLGLAGGAPLAGELALVLLSATPPGAGTSSNGVAIPLSLDGLTIAALQAPAAIGLFDSLVDLNAGGNSEHPRLDGGLPPGGLVGTDLWVTWLSLGFAPGQMFVQAAGEARSLRLTP